MNNLILNRLFTQRILLNLINKRRVPIYQKIIKQYIGDTCNVDNLTVFKHVYSFMSKEYRNEYFYRNTLLNKLLFGIHSLKTTTALIQIPISKSRADFIMINGKAVVYEIKTELDSLVRLKSQIDDYYTAFDHVCVVTSVDNFDKVVNLLSGTSVGIYVLTEDNRISKTMKKEPKAMQKQLLYESMFNILRKEEYESVLQSYFGYLPKSTPVFYYSECLKLFKEIPKDKAYKLFINVLKERGRKILPEIKDVPYELKSLVYFGNIKNKEYDLLKGFLKNTYRGD